MSVASAERKTKKKGGGLSGLLRKEKEPITEEELMKKDVICPDDVLRLNRVTEGILMIISQIHEFTLIFSSP